MKFETVLFAAAFLLLAIFSFPGNAGNDDREVAKPPTEPSELALAAVSAPDEDREKELPPEDENRENTGADNE